MEDLAPSDDSSVPEKQKDKQKQKEAKKANRQTETQGQKDRIREWSE